MKRISILFSMVLLLMSCGYDTSDGDCKTSSYTSFYDIQDIQANGLVYQGLVKEKYKWWHSSPIIDVKNSANVESLKFIIELEGEYTWQSTNNDLYKRINLSPINIAIASCPGPIEIQKTYEVISKLTITSDAIFNNSHPVGSSLNDLFIVKYTDGNGVKTSFNLDASLDSNVNEFVLASPPGMKKIHLMLSVAPDFFKIHNFKIVYMHTNGERFEKYLGPIKFQ